MKPFFDSTLAERLSAMPLSARSSMLGTVSGRHQSPHRGSSVEFAEYRRYQPGDDLRRLDWRAFGRSDRHYVKEFEADTNLRLVLVVDASGSMGFGRKLDYARRVSAILAYLAIGQGDAAGLMTASESAKVWLPPRRIEGQIAHLMEALDEIRSAGATVLDQTLHEVAETIRKRAMVVVISDLLTDLEPLRNSLEHLLFRKHDVALFHLIEPEEISPSWNRPVRLQDMEGGEAMTVDPDEVRLGYEIAVREFLDEIEQMTRESAVDYQRMLLDQPIESALVRFMEGRSRDVVP